MKLRVKELREKAFLSQQELADRAGLTVWAIKKLESPRSVRPYPRTIRQVAAALGVEPDRLVIKDTD